MEDPIKRLRSRWGQEVVRAYENLTDGWRNLLRRSGGSTTRFGAGRTHASPDFPGGSLPPAEIWETAHAVIIRIETPGMNQDDPHISVHGGVVRVQGGGQPGNDLRDRLNGVAARASGRFVREIPLPLIVDGSRAEVSHQDGVVTVILPKKEMIPPRPFESN